MRKAFLVLLVTILMYFAYLSNFSFSSLASKTGADIEECTGFVLVNVLIINSSLYVTLSNGNRHVTHRLKNSLNLMENIFSDKEIFVCEVGGRTAIKFRMRNHIIHI